MPPPSKRRKFARVEQVTFDPAERQDYLTGFHRRKQERVKHAQEEAARKQRMQKIADRKELREQRKRGIERHVDEVNTLVRKAEGVSEEGEEEQQKSSQHEYAGFIRNTTDPAEESGHDEEYVDEDRYTTVTVEPMELNGQNGEAEFNAANADASEDQNPKRLDDSADKNHLSRQTARAKDTASSSSTKKKRKKFRYENKAERKATQRQQSLKNSKAARARKNANHG